jgi:hypothetical protein
VTIINEINDYWINHLIIIYQAFTPCYSRQRKEMMTKYNKRDKKLIFNYCKVGKTITKNKEHGVDEYSNYYNIDEGVGWGRIFGLRFLRRSKRIESNKIKSSQERNHKH